LKVVVVVVVNRITLYCRKSHTLIIPSSPPDAIKCCSLPFQLTTLTSLSCELSIAILHAELGSHRASQIRSDLSTEHEQNTCIIQSFKPMNTVNSYRKYGHNGRHTAGSTHILPGNPSINVLQSNNITLSVVTVNFIHSFTFNSRHEAHAVEYNGKIHITIKIKS